MSMLEHLRGERDVRVPKEDDGRLLANKDEDDNK